MSPYPASIYGLMKHDKHDQARARLFDEWLIEQPEPVRLQCGYYLFVFKDSFGLSDIGARSLLASLIFLVASSESVDELDKVRAHGEAIRARFEWAMLDAEVRG